MKQVRLDNNNCARNFVFYWFNRNWVVLDLTSYLLFKNSPTEDLVWVEIETSTSVENNKAHLSLSITKQSNTFWLEKIFPSSAPTIDESSTAFKWRKVQVVKFNHKHQASSKRMALCAVQGLCALLLSSAIIGQVAGYIHRLPYHRDCRTGFCPVLVIDWDGEQPICPARYRFNIDHCVPTAELCEEARRHRLFCSTDKRDWG